MHSFERLGSPPMRRVLPRDVQGLQDERRHPRADELVLFLLDKYALLQEHV
jgi:hypothetical protein